MPNIIMPLPSAQQIQDRQKEVEEHRRRLQKAYDDFLVSWGEVEREERELVEKIRKYGEKSSIHTILQKISNIKE